MSNPSYDPDYPDGPDNDPGGPATEAEAAAEYVRNVGRDEPDREWIATPWDSWGRNPYYTGAPGPHPEADDDDRPAQERNQRTKLVDDEIPF